VPISPLLHCPPLPHRADMSTPAFSTPPFLTVPFCPLPQIPSTPPLQTLYSWIEGAYFKGREAKMEGRGLGEGWRVEGKNDGPTTTKGKEGSG